MFTEVVKLSEQGQRHYSHHNDVFGFDSSSAILKIEWRVAGQVHTAHVQRFFRPVFENPKRRRFVISQSDHRIDQVGPSLFSSSERTKGGA